MGHSPARRVTPSLQTPLLICFLAPFFGCPAKEGLVHGPVTSPVHTRPRMEHDGPTPTPDRADNTSGPLHYVEAALGWAGPEKRDARYLRQESQNRTRTAVAVHPGTGVARGQWLRMPSAWHRAATRTCVLP